MPIRKAIFRSSFGTLSQGLLLALVMAAPFSISVTAQGPPERKRVLIVFSNDSSTPTQVTIERALSSALRAGSPAEIETYTEYVGDTRAITNYDNEFIALMKRKYEGQKFDLIFSMRQLSSRMLLENRDELFPGTPIIFLALDKRNTEGIYPAPGVTGVWGEINFLPNLELALALHPGTRRVVVIGGVSDTDKFWRAQAQKDFSEYESSLEFTYLTGLNVPEMQQALANLPPETIVFFTTNVRDNAGNVYESPNYLRQVSPASAAPIYGTTEAQLGNGIVGGSLLGFETLGSEAGRVGLRILAGEQPDTIAPQGVSSLPIFDWRELQRWNISESGLPKGSIVRFKQLTVWEEYKWYIIGFTSAITIETLLIGWLVYLRSRKRMAERERNEFQVRAEVDQRRLEEVVRNVPGAVWESRLRSGPDDRETIFISDRVSELFGYSPEEYKSEPGLLNKLVVEEQREWFAEELRRLLESGDELVIVFKIRTRTGEEKWVEGHVTVQRDESGAAVGISGVTLDVTDRQIADDRLAAKQRQLTEAQRLAQVGSWEWDEETDEVTWSDETYRIYGLDPAGPAPTFMEHRRLLVPESWGRLSLEVENTLQTGDPYEIDIEFVRVDGEHGWASARGELTVLGGGIKRLRGTLQDITARKKAEAELVKSEERYRNVIETQTELICRFLPDTTLTFVNNAYCRYFSKSQAELVGTKFVDLIPPDARDTALARIASILETQHPETYEHEVLRPDGTRGWQHWTDSPVETLNGNPRELQGIGRDITEKQLAVEELRASETRFRTLADNAPVLIWMTDRQTEWTFFNNPTLLFTGKRVDELKGHGWLVLVHKEDQKRVIKTYTEANANQRSYKMEYRLLHADGGYRWLQENGVPNISPQGTFLGFIGTCTDISHLKSAETALRESEERFRNIADTAPVLIWMSGVHGENTFINRYGLDFTGLGIKEFEGHGWFGTVHKDDKEQVSAAFRSAHNSREIVVSEFRLRRADGAYRWFYSTASPRIDPDGKFLGFIGTCVDIDDRKGTERALQVAVSEISQLKNKLQEENIYLKEEIKLIHDFDEIVGESEALKYILFKIEQVAATDATVLITGETGTGKELVARALHGASHQKHMPLVKVNCAALAAGFIESELFGHEKGSFTGATYKRIGRFELARGGTIFLDEIGELPMDLQVKLLRVLQEGEFERLGSSTTIKVDVRVIAATNRDLKAEVEKGNFREDLLFRLNVFPITVPPLRERKDDIPLLLNYFVQRFAKRLGKNITSVAPGVIRTLMAHSWPGNIRELANVIERSVISTKEHTLRSIEGLESTAVFNGITGPPDTLEEIERKYIAEILTSTDWRVEGKAGAAQILGLNPSTLRTRMHKLGISRAMDKTNGS